MKKRISLTLDFTIEIHESHLDQPSHNQAEQAHYERLKRVDLNEMSFGLVASA